MPDDCRAATSPTIVRKFLVRNIPELIVLAVLIAWVIFLVNAFPAHGQSLTQSFSTNYSRTNLTGSGGYNTNFSRTNLFGSGIFSTNFSRTNLSSAGGFNTNFSRTNLSSAGGFNTNFSRTNLTAGSGSSTNYSRTNIVGGYIAGGTASTNVGGSGGGFSSTPPGNIIPNPSDSVLWTNSTNGIYPSGVAGISSQWIGSTSAIYPSSSPASSSKWTGSSLTLYPN
jgi:hypothetical protein